MIRFLPYTKDPERHKRELADRSRHYIMEDMKDEQALEPLPVNPRSLTVKEYREFEQLKGQVGFLQNKIYEMLSKKKKGVEPF